MTKFLLFPLAFFVFLVVGGCSATLEDYKNDEPKLKLNEFFTGDLIAHGVFHNYTGKLSRHFCAEVNGSWEIKNGKLTGVLDERFTFNDGENQTRIWTLVQQSSNKFTGTAGDVVGTAHGETRGNAFYFEYVLAIPDGDDTINVKIEDWIFQLDDNRAFNRSVLKKFGFDVGEIFIFFDKTQTRCPSKA